MEVFKRLKRIKLE